MGVKFPALQAQIRHVEDETGCKVPVDVEDADYMLLLSSMEIMNFPEYLEAIARIMHQAGKTWTIANEGLVDDEIDDAGVSHIALFEVTANSPLDGVVAYVSNG